MVLLLSTYDSRGGAARACERLSAALAGKGVPAAHLVREKCSRTSSARPVVSKGFGRLCALADGLAQHLYPQRQPYNFSPAWFPSGVIAKCLRMQPEVLHLHWVAEGFIRIEDLGRVDCPIVWTLHDSWLFTGGCHLPGECRRYLDDCGLCPVLGSKVENDLSRRVWQRKRRSLPVSRMTVVVPSQWLAAQAKASALLQGCAVEVIPNGIDTILYSPGDKLTARKSLGLPLGRKIILFGGNNVLSDSNKGAPLLWEALARLDAGTRSTCTLVIFGDRSAAIPSVAVEAVNCGVIDDENRLVELYRAADLLVMTSRQENLPNMIVEAMACGLPCVAFGVGGIPEQIAHRRSGCLASPYDTAALAEEISWLLADGEVQATLPDAARRHAVENYSLDLIAGKHATLYQKVKLPADQ